MKRKGTLMAVYWLARAKIINPVEYKKFNDAARAIWHRYPRKVVARGGRYELLEGEAIYQLHRAGVRDRRRRQGLLLLAGVSAAAKFRRDAGNINELVLVEGVAEPT